MTKNEFKLFTEVLLDSWAVRMSPRSCVRVGFGYVSAADRLVERGLVDFNPDDLDEIYLTDAGERMRAKVIGVLDGPVPRRRLRRSKSVEES